jgi:MFS family permease
MARIEDRIPLRVYVAELRAFKEAFKLLVSMFFLWTGLHAFLPFITIFPTKVAGASKSQALVVYVVLILASAALSYPAGRLGARYGNRRCVILGTITLVAAALIGLVVPSYAWLFPLAILAGTGFAFTNVLTYPLLSQLIPGSKVGVFTGIQTAFGAAAVPVSVLINGTLISHLGFRSMFGFLAAMMLLDILCLLTIDERAAEKQVRAVEEAERAVAARSGIVAAV